MSRLQAACDGKMCVIGVKMNDVKSAGVTENPLELQGDVCGCGFLLAAGAQCVRHNGNQFRPRLRIAAGVKGHVMPAAN